VRLLALVLLCACEAREIAPPEPTFDDVGPVFARACAECHGDAGDWRAGGFLDVIACPDGTTSATDGAIERALARSDHQGLLDAREVALVTAWLEAGAPARRGAAHPSGFVDPRSPDFHGRALREVRWAPLFDAEHPRYCARCHEGVDPHADAGSAPGATSCASCHTEEQNALACSTCHGDEGRASPPRDPCWFPDDRAGAHAAHASTPCALCHGERDTTSLRDGEHGDGVVQVIAEGWDPSARTCASPCHARGGGGPSAPRWDETLALDCASCHESPPADHYAGPCSACHDEAHDERTLRPGPLHGNGRVDLGDGSGGCGACHGSGDDAWPSGDTSGSSGAHVAHRAPSIAAPFACEECHVVPDEPSSPGHFDDTVGAEVTFGALARARGSTPVYDTGTCSEVACHGAGLGGGVHVAPVWDGDRGGACGSCHGVPPPPPHVARDDCGASICHGGAIAPGPTFTELGRRLHVDGTVQP
jgi:predicted CxxxxCH...CXXCH cytochrome family protein